MAALLFPLNFALSWLNAWACGKTWTESKANGGFPHFLNWMGAIMSASGFTWCYLLIFGFLAAQVPITNEDTGILALAAALAGIVTTASILKYTARKTAVERSFRYTE